jgi:hypothetical protein
MTLRTFLSIPSPPLWRFCLLAFPLALIPSVALYVGVRVLLAAIHVNTAALAPRSIPITPWTVFGMVILSPVTDPFLLAGGLYILSKLIPRRPIVAFASAIAWGGLHALFGVLWFFGTVWSFFVFSCAFLAWRQLSFRHAYVAAAVPHMLINLTGVLLITVGKHA